VIQFQARISGPLQRIGMVPQLTYNGRC
jgi:hypothetical protein